MEEGTALIYLTRFSPPPFSDCFCNNHWGADVSSFDQSTDSASARCVSPQLQSMLCSQSQKVVKEVRRASACPPPTCIPCTTRLSLQTSGGTCQSPCRKAFVHADRCALCAETMSPANMRAGSSNLEAQPSRSHTWRCAHAPPSLPPPLTD